MKNASTNVCGRAAPWRAIDLNPEILLTQTHLLPASSVVAFLSCLSPDGVCDWVARPIQPEVAQLLPYFLQVPYLQPAGLDAHGQIPGIGADGQRQCVHREWQKNF